MTLVLIGKKPCFGGFNPHNRGQTGSRYIYIYAFVASQQFFLGMFDMNDTPIAGDDLEEIPKIFQMFPKL